MDVELARLSAIGLVRVMMASSHADLSDLIGVCGASDQCALVTLGMIDGALQPLYMAGLNKHTTYPYSSKFLMRA